MSDTKGKCLEATPNEEMRVYKGSGSKSVCPVLSVALKTSQRAVRQRIRGNGSQ